MTTLNLTTFDYESLDTTTRLSVQKATHDIRVAMRMTARSIIVIGERLIDVKRLLGHGQFMAWLDVEFEMAERTARNYMAVAETFGDSFKSATVADSISAKALYMLSSGSTPESAREEAIQIAEAGEHVTATKAKQIIAAHKPTAPEGYTVWYTTHRGETYHLVEGTKTLTACGKLTTYLSRKPREGVTYHVCDKCQAKAAAPTPVTHEGQALHTEGIDDSTSPDEPVQRKTPDGHWITEDGLILRYIPGTDRGWCPRCGDWSNFMLMGQDTWACKKCDWRVQDDAIRIWEPEPPDPIPHRPASTPTILPDNMLADLQEAQRLLRKWWERLPSSSITRTYVDQALVNVGKAIVSAGKAPASAAFGKPAERIQQ